jgi:hypothetical protein
MPDPWPVLSPPDIPAKSSPVRPKVRGFSLPGSRLALAATLAFCLIGSLGLASLFPRDSLPDGDRVNDSIAPNDLWKRPVNTPPLREVTPEPSSQGEPYTDVSPAGTRVKGRESYNGNKARITVEPIGPSSMDE